MATDTHDRPTYPTAADVIHNHYDPKSKFRTAVGTIAAFLLLGIPIGITFLLQGNYAAGIPAIACAVLGLVASVITLK